MAIYLPEALRLRLYAADRGRCAYCQTDEQNSGISLVPEHIVPQAKGGATVFENLCLACRPCNEYKAALTEAPDPLTGLDTALFNPRTQNWRDHFAWSQDGLHILGLTASGRATIVTLRLNRPLIVATRRRWVSAQWHPPADG